MTRLLRAGLTLLLTLALCWIVGSASSAGAVDASPGVAGTVTPALAAPGAQIVVQSTGWPAHAQVQGTVCGNLGVGGSVACDQTTGQLGAADAKGNLRLGMLVGKPPKPCPCIVRVASYGGTSVSLDIPFTVVGQRVGTPPKIQSPEADVVVTGVRIEAPGSVAALFGGGQDAQVVVTLYNRGNLVATDPSVMVGVGKSDDLEPTDVTATHLTIEPLQSVDVTIDARLPAGAFGSYFAVATMDDSDDVPMKTAMGRTYPWGLFALNALGLLAVGWGVWRRRTAPARRERAEAKGRLDGREYALPDVVYLESVGGFLLSPAAAKRARVLGKVTARVEVDDLVALAQATPSESARPPAETASLS